MVQPHSRTSEALYGNFSEHAGTVAADSVTLGWTTEFHATKIVIFRKDR
jgi:hypothetical protein